MSIKSDKRDKVLKFLKKMIWLYLLLLLFEGALRKWFLPFLSGPLLLVRDPLALIILFYGYSYGFLRLNLYLMIMVFATLLSICATFVFGHGNIGICIYGARITILHFPLIFIIGNVFDEFDVLKVGRVLLYITIPMTILMILQFYSPQSALVNRGIGGDIEGGGFIGGALGFYRPPGTFSFISGLTCFYGITTCFVFYFWTKPKSINKVVLILSSICVFAAVPFSISRTLFFTTVLTLLFFLFAVSLNPKNIMKVIGGTLGAMVVLVLLSNIDLFKTPIEAFTVRFEGANETEGGVESVLLGRYLGGMFGAVVDNRNTAFFGEGLGIATNAGSQLFKGYQRKNHWVEKEWERIIYESGLIIGVIIILVRLLLALNLAVSAFKKLFSKDMLPWLLLSYCALILPNGQWQTPTTLGFGIFVSGILMACFNKRKVDNENYEAKL